MPEDAASWGLFAAVLLFVVFLVVKARLPLGGRGSPVAQKKIADARRRAKEAGDDASARAKAFRDARALEKLLWRRLAEEASGEGEAHDRAFDELIALYEGPLRRPDQAVVLRRLRGQPLADQSDKISSK